MDDLFNALATSVDITETNIEVPTTANNVDNSAILGNLDLITQAEFDNAKEQEEKLVEEDTTDYTTDLPQILFSRKLDLLEVLLKVSPILDTNSKRAISRGISLIGVDDKHIKIVSPNELYYFSTILEVESNTLLAEGETIFLEYIFLQKITRFFLPKIRITKKDNKFYILLATGELELLNFKLIDNDLKLLTPDYEVLEDKVVKEINLSSLYGTLTTLSKVVNFESDAPRRILSTKSGLSSFKSSLIYAGAPSELPDITLKPKEMAYLIQAAKLADNETKIKVLETSSQLTRYAFVYDNTTMITNYALPKDDPRVLGLLTDLPALTDIDYANLKYNLDYASSIIYAFGVFTLVNEDGVLKAKIKLQNASEAPVQLDILSELTLPLGKEIKVNTKTLLQAMNALDAGSATKIGYKEGLLYLVNSSITLVLVTL